MIRKKLGQFATCACQETLFRERQDVDEEIGYVLSTQVTFGPLWRIIIHGTSGAGI